MIKRKETFIIKRRNKARRLVLIGQKLALKHVQQGWTEKDFQKAFLKVYDKITKFL